MAEGSGRDLVLDKKPTKLGRVREETLLSDRSLLVGAASVLAMAGYLVARPKLLKAR